MVMAVVSEEGEALCYVELEASVVDVLNIC